MSAKAYILFAIPGILSLVAALWAHLEIRKIDRYRHGRKVEPPKSRLKVITPIPFSFKNRG